MSDDKELEGSGVEISPALIGWGIAAFIVTIMFCTYNNAPMVLGASFLAKLCAVALGSVLGFVGAIVGDGIRKFVKPDSFYTTGGFFKFYGLSYFGYVVLS